MTAENQTPALAPASASARVTIDDVRTVLEGTDPNQTNAGKVRVLLGGRGSFETIQKHLGTLRAELAAASAPPLAVDQVPAMPAEAALAMWVAAWTAAQLATMTRAEKLAAERDAALLKLESMGQDVSGLVTTVDEQSAQLDAAAAVISDTQSAMAAAHVQAAADSAKAQAATAHAADELARVTAAAAQSAAAAAVEIEQLAKSAAANLAKVRADAAHASELADAGRELMRQELMRLTDQIGELKAALYKRADSAPSAPAVVAPLPPLAN